MISDKYRLILEEIARTESDYHTLEDLIKNLVDEHSNSLKTERDKALAYLDQTLSILAELDVDGKIIYVNKRVTEVTEYELDDLLGHNWFELLSPEEDRQTIIEGFCQVIQGKRDPSPYTENYILTKTGKRRLIAWHNSHHFDPQTGAITSMFISGEDITIRRGIEEALHQNELRYRQMFYNNHAMKLVLDPGTGEIVDANESACQYYGYDYETLVQMNISQINTLPLEALLGESLTALRERKNYQFQHRLASGEIRDVEVYSGPITLDGDELQFSIILDVTEREKSKRELQLRESQFRTAVSHFPNGMMIMFDTELNCILARGQLIHDEIESLEALEGKYLPDALPEMVWHHVGKMYEDVLKGQSTQVNFERNDRHFMAQVEPLFDDEQTLIGGLHLFQDITHIRKSEQLLQETTQQLNTILDGIVDGVALVARDEYLLYANDAAATILGFESASEMLDTLKDNLYIKHETLDETGAFLVFEEQAIYKALQGETPPSQRIIYRNPKTGREIWTETKAKPIFDNDGNVRFAVVIINDITRAHQIEQFKLNALQEQAQIETLQKYIANTTHDISQPLSVINTAVYMLDKVFQDEQVQKRTNSIKMQSMRIQSILKDIRQMSMLDTVSKLEFAPIDMQRLMEQIADYSQNRILENNQHFDYHCSATRFMIIGNAQYLERAITQVVQNAMDFTPDNGHIQMRCLEKSGNFIVEIKDSGIGMEESHMPFIFDRFYRVDKSRTSSPSSGTGLGLSITKRIMDLHGGEIEVESTPDDGSIFRLIFPLQLSE